MAGNRRDKRRSRSPATESSGGEASPPQQRARYLNAAEVDALFDRVVAAQAKQLEDARVAHVAEVVAMRTSIKEEVKAEMGTVVAALTTVVNEELVAHGQRMPSAQQAAVLTSTMVIDAVKDLIPSAGAAAMVPFDQRSMDEVRVAVARVLSLSQIRRCHALAVCLTVLRLAVSASAKGDCITCFFPPASKQAGQNSHAIKNFKRVNIAVLNKIITDMGAAGNTPAVFQGLSGVVPSRIGRCEEAALSFIRNSLNDGRSVGREYFYRGPGYALEKENGRIKVRMAFPDAVKPTVNDASVSPYFMARVTLVASPSGRVGAAAAAVVEDSEEGEDLPPLLDGERVVVRDFSVWKLSSDVLVSIVRHGFDFDERVIFAVANCICDIIVKGSKPWRAAVARDSQTEEYNLPGCWDLLMPRMSKRLQLDQIIQTLTADELIPGGSIAAAPVADDLDGEADVGDDDIDLLGA